MQIARRLPILLVFFLASSIAISAIGAPITLRVDASEAARKIYHAEMTVPVSPGPVTLMYPKWIPGEHAPTGPITDLAGLKIFAGSRLLEWRRLEADTIIRKQTQNRKSLDDFCHAFYGGTSGPPEVKPYTLDDVVRTLNTIAPYDWSGFFDARVNKTGTSRAPVAGLEAGGYRLTYRDQPSEMQRSGEQVSRNVSVAYSIGLRLREDGSISDVLPEKAAAKAGLAPGMQLKTVNGREYSGEVLRDAIREAASGEMLELVAVNDKTSSTYKLDYHDGEKYPVLERNGQPPLLDDILKPRVK